MHRHAPPLLRLLLKMTTSSTTSTTDSSSTTDTLSSSFFHSFDISPPHHGCSFLPRHDPLPRLPQPEFQPHEDVAALLPTLLTSSTARQAIESLPCLSASTTQELLHTNQEEQRRALLLLAGLASAYVWGGGEDVIPRDFIPAAVAVPLYAVAQMLETPPILSHQSTCLYNWQRRRREGEGEGERGGGEGEEAPKDRNERPLLKASDLELTFSFTGDDNEKMFYLLTLEIEAVGGQALPLLEKARRVAKQSLAQTHKEYDEVEEENVNMMEAIFAEVRTHIQGMQQIMLSMPRLVEPAFFYHRVRPYLSGWSNNPTLPQGVVYEGVFVDTDTHTHTHKEKDAKEEDVRERKGTSLQFSGGSAAQSSIIAALDLYLGVNHDVAHKHTHTHKHSPKHNLAKSYAFLKAMRVYMPKGHRSFLEMLEGDMSVCVCVKDQEHENGNGNGKEATVERDAYVMVDVNDKEKEKEPPMLSSSIRCYTLSKKERHPRLASAYDGCVEALSNFRKSHLGIVHLYIVKQQQQQKQQQKDQQEEEGGGRKGLEKAAGGKGTGGMALQEFLEPLRRQTLETKVGRREEEDESTI